MDCSVSENTVGGVVWGWGVVDSEFSVEAPKCEARRSLCVTPTPGSFVAAGSVCFSLWVKFDAIATLGIHGPKVVLGWGAAPSARFPCTRLPDFQFVDSRPIRNGLRAKAKIWP